MWTDKLQSGYVGEPSVRSPSSVSRDEDGEREAGEMTATSQQQQQTVAGLAAQRFPQLAAEAAAAAARVPCLSSLESLLINIQGILKVAVEAARYREQQLDRERGEFLLYLIFCGSFLFDTYTTIINLLYLVFRRA